MASFSFICNWWEDYTGVVCKKGFEKGIIQEKNEQIVDFRRRRLWSDGEGDSPGAGV